MPSNSIERAQARLDGKIVTRTARCAVGEAVLADGRKRTPEEVSDSLRWLGEIVLDQARKRVFEVWSAKAVLDLPKHPSHAYVAMLDTYDHLSWPPDGIHASQRVLRMAEEMAGRTLRSAARPLSILEAMVNFEPLPPQTTEVEQRDLWRSVDNYRLSHGGEPPDSVYDLISCPDLSGGWYSVPLDAADDQQVKLQGDRLSILLPLCENPTKDDWVWHTLTLVKNSYSAERYPDGVMRRPSLRITPEKTYFLVPLDMDAPDLIADKRAAEMAGGPASSGLRVGEAPGDRLATNFGGDYGERRLQTGAVTTLDENGDVTTTGRPFYFDAGDLQDKQGRRRDEGYHLNDEIARLKAEQAAAARPAPARAVKIVVLEQESSCIWHRVSQCDRQLEHATAKWRVETALAEGATTIVDEDLDGMESRGMGRDINARCANQPRGGVQKRTREKAQMAGLEVKSVNPRGTSSLCSRCGKKSVFWQAPDRRYGKVNKKTGKRAQHQNWLLCEDCRSSDRDHASGESIGARGFDAPQARRNSLNKPVAGPRSQRPITVKKEKSQPKTKEIQARETAQALPFPTYEQAQHAPRSCRAVSSCRVDRGSALPGATQLPERRTLTARQPAERQPARVLDGMANGYWRRIHFSRPRALVAPPIT